MMMVWVGRVKEGQRFEGIWYGPLVIVERWPEKLVAKDHIAAHSSVETHHCLPKAYNPFHHGLGGRTSSRRQVGIHIGRKSSGGPSHLNQHTNPGRRANQ